MWVRRGLDHTDIFPLRVGDCLGHRDWSVWLELVRGVFRLRRSLWEAPRSALALAHGRVGNTSKPSPPVFPPLTARRLNASRGTNTDLKLNDSTFTGAWPPRDPAKPTTSTFATIVVPLVHLLSEPHEVSITSPGVRDDVESVFGVFGYYRVVDDAAFFV